MSAPAAIATPLALAIWGASGHARVIADALERVGGAQVRVFIDDTSPADAHRRFLDRPVVDSPARAAALVPERWAVVAIGDCAARLRLAERLKTEGWRLLRVIHPSAVVSSSAEIGDGSQILAGAVVGPGARIGANVIVNTGASVDHDCVIEDGVHIAPGTHLGGGVRVGRGTFLGINVGVRNHLSIGAGTVVGVGAAVVKDLPAGVLALGVPARVVRALREEA